MRIKGERLKMTKECFNFHCIIVFLGAVVALFFACIVLIVLWNLFHGGWRIKATPNGIISMQDFWFQYKALIEAFFYSFTLFVAAYSLDKYINVETCRALGEIRTKLNTDGNRKVHSFLLKKTEFYFIHQHKNNCKDLSENDFSSIDLFDYLGTLELGAIMLKRKVISFTLFNNQFGYRIVNAYKNDFIRSHIEDPNNNYIYLRYAVEELRKRGELSNG